jgi:hypothetical protein
MVEQDIGQVGLESCSRILSYLGWRGQVAEGRSKVIMLLRLGQGMTQPGNRESSHREETGYTVQESRMSWLFCLSSFI